jgi:serine/threonine protein kinase
MALKTLPGEQVADSERRRRFLVEAQAASRLNHPNIVTIHDISEENGVCFIAMEYVAGTTLEQANTGNGVPLKLAMKYAGEIADALAAGEGVDPETAIDALFIESPKNTWLPNGHNWQRPNLPRALGKTAPVRCQR